MSPRLVFVSIAAAAFVAEVLIATVFSSLKHVRGSLSDFLVVIFLYFLLKAWRDFAPMPLAAAIFLFACAVEVSQYFHLADALGLPRGSLLSILMGNTFSLGDIAMYFAGTATAYVADLWLAQRGSRAR